MKINWKIRLKNPVFWRNIILAVIAPMLTQLGMDWGNITTWGAFWNIFVQAAANPGICVAVAVSVWNAINDPTTAGDSDSKQALAYDEPKKDA